MKKITYPSICLLLLSLTAGCADMGENNPFGENAPLPAAMTRAETIGKADHYDPRDAHPSYAYTAAPSDVRGLPGEHEDVERLLLGISSGTNELVPFFVDIMEAASAETEVDVLVPSSAYVDYFRDRLSLDNDNINFFTTGIDSIWMRDYGPEVVRTRDGKKRVIDPRYYWGRFQDDAMPTVLANYWDMPVSRPPIEMEGGNLLSDGAGRCVATDDHVPRNNMFGYDASDIKRIFKDYFGCETTVLVPALQGEGTGHVDMFVTITGPGKVIVGRYTRAQDRRNAVRLDNAANMLRDAGFEVTRIPMPDNDGRRVWRTYTNSIPVDGTVLVPVYDEDETYEGEALEIYTRAYPGREIVTIDSDTIIEWSGAVHCVTMTVAK